MIAQVQFCDCFRFENICFKHIVDTATEIGRDGNADCTNKCLDTCHKVTMERSAARTNQGTAQNINCHRKDKKWEEVFLCRQAEKKHKDIAESLAGFVNESSV